MTAPDTFLGKLREHDRAVLEQKWTVRPYDRNEMIIAHGEEGRELFFVMEGRARATAFSENGRAVAYRNIGPGEIFGELAAIDGGMRSASVVALESVCVACLSEDRFRETMDTQPDFAWAMLEHLSKQVRRLTERVYESSTLVVHKRLTRELLRLASDHGYTEGGASITPAPTHSDLAAMIGTHREAVSREMSALVKTGLIAKRKGSLELNDLDMLALLSSGEE